MTNTLPLCHVKAGLFLVISGLLFGFFLGVTFGVNEDVYKQYVTEGIAAHPEQHDAKSQDKIWRYAQRAHFHATGISAFSLGLVILVALSNMRARLKSVTAILIGLGSLYSLAWFSMYLLAPEFGRDAAHEHIVTEIFTYIGVTALLVGILLLCVNLFLGMLGEAND
jgi:predicted cobalt transporter CbtA